jgi:hypothetical protein
MKPILLVIIFLALVPLTACATHPPATTPLVSPATLAAPAVAPTQTATSTANEETEIRTLVENFGKQLQNVSLQAPDAAQEIRAQYSEFVAPALLETWTKAVLKAPGRIVSSPWPARIEISSLTKQGSDSYQVSGFVVEITSLEVVGAGTPLRIPVQIVVQRAQTGWLITGYIEKP